jgi:hypothetical protein
LAGAAAQPGSTGSGSGWGAGSGAGSGSTAGRQPGVDQISGLAGLAGVTAGVGAGSAAVAQVAATVQASVTADDLIDQVVQHLAGAKTLGDGTQQTTLTLNPEGLGQLTVTVQVKAGQVKLELAGSGHAMHVLAEHLEQLKRGLEGSGLNLSDVNLRQQDSTDSSSSRQNPWAGQPDTGAGTDTRPNRGATSDAGDRDRERTGQPGVESRGVTGRTTRRTNDIDASRTSSGARGWDLTA